MEDRKIKIKIKKGTQMTLMFMINRRFTKRTPFIIKILTLLASLIIYIYLKQRSKLVTKVSGNNYETFRS